MTYTRFTHYVDSNQVTLASLATPAKLLRKNGLEGSYTLTGHFIRKTLGKSPGDVFSYFYFHRFVDPVSTVATDSCFMLIGVKSDVVPQ